MKLLPKARSGQVKPREKTDEGGPGDVEETSSLAMEWTGPAAWVTKTLTGLLITCLVAGPIALLLAGWLTLSLATTPPPAPPAGDTAAAVDERAAVSAFAGDFVVAWLTTARGQEKRLASYMAAGRTGLELPEKPWLVWSTDVAGITGKAGEWSVTVAATVAESAKTPAMRMYFQVPVLYADRAMIATSLPAPVAAPQQAPARAIDYRNHLGSTDPVALATSEFLKALLVTGDVSRVISPSSKIRAVSPAPFTSVELVDAAITEDPEAINQAAPADGTEVTVFATAVGTPAAKSGQLTLQYALTLVARGSRWEISVIDPSPLLASATTPVGDPDLVDPTTDPTTSVPPGAETTTTN